MNNLLTWQFWFNLRPEPLVSLAQNSLIALMAILIVLTIILAILKRKSGLYRGFLKRLYSFTLSNTLLSLIFIFFNYEMIPFFSARFWLGLWILMMLIWLILIFKNFGKISLHKKELEHEQELKKYLP